MDFNHTGEVLLGHVDDTDGGMLGACVGQASRFGVWNIVLLVKDQASSAAVNGVKGSVRTIFEVNALCFEISRQWKDYRVVLIERRTVDPFKSVDSRDLLNETMKISPKLHCAVPFLKSKPRHMSFLGTRW